jgi:hypothetical protein
MMRILIGFPMIALMLPNLFILLLLKLGSVRSHIGLVIQSMVSIMSNLEFQLTWLHQMIRP